MTNNTAFGQAGAAAEAGDPFDLARFLEAQDTHYANALGELLFGRKRSHWMWFVFPQWIGLGSSPMSQRYAIRSLQEARAYLAHPVLGARLVECTKTVNALKRTTVRAVFGSTDAQKFWSCMTLFALVAERDTVFHAALTQHFDGVRDDATLQLVSAAPHVAAPLPPVEE